MTEEYITEQDLASQLNVSRTPLREAMSELINENLIEFKPRKGYRVKEYSKDEIEQIFSLRKLIELAIIPSLLTKCDKEGLNSLKNIIKEQEDCLKKHDNYNFMTLDKSFHRQMFLISERNIFLQSYDVFHNLTIFIGSQVIKQKGRMEEVIQEHQEIVNSLEEKNKEKLEQSINKHLITTQKLYIDK